MGINRRRWICIQINPTSSVAKLKELIHYKTRISPQEQNLSLFGTHKPLLDDNYISDYNINNGTKIEIELRLKSTWSTYDMIHNRDKPFNLLRVITSIVILYLVCVCCCWSNVSPIQAYN